MRTRFINTLTQVAAEDDRICLVVGDLGYSVVERFAERFPDRFLNAGVAEQNMTGLAAGWAMTGKVVFTYSIANFPTLRCLEQLRNDVCYHNLPVKVVSVGGGFAYGSHGYTHHGLEDLGGMRAMPRMMVASPADAAECEAALRWMIDSPGPAYLRLGRNGEPDIHPGPVRVQDGMICLREGDDLALVATGTVLGEAVAAAEALHQRGIEAAVWSAPVLKPFGEASFLRLAQQVPLVITVEEHCEVGGLGAACAAVLAEHQPGARLVRRFVPEKLNKLGSQSWMRAACGLDADSLIREAGQQLVRQEIGCLLEREVIHVRSRHTAP
jgi:transketolase